MVNIFPVRIIGAEDLSCEQGNRIEHRVGMPDTQPKMTTVLPLVKSIIREEDANIDVRIIRRGRSILYRVEPRKVQLVHKELKQWQCSSSEVQQLIKAVLTSDKSQTKYQTRSNTSSTPSLTSPKYASTPHANERRSPVPPGGRTSSVGRSRDGRTQSAASSRTTGTQTSLGRAANIGLVREKPPEPAQIQRPGSSHRSHSAAYNPRSSACQPSHMFQNEDLRTAAKLNRPPSHVYQCDEQQDRSRSTRRMQSPRRFNGTPVQLPQFMRENEFLTHEELSVGQKQYIWGIARIYSTSHLMQLKQRQYQNLLDYEFNRRIHNKELKEHERAKEFKDYMRYTRFIKRYDKRIPRANKHHSERSPCEELAHIHKHVIKGWTTNPRANDDFKTTGQQSQDTAALDTDNLYKDGMSRPLRDKPNHIHRHVIKGWTTNQDADEGYRPASRLGQRDDSEDVTDETSDSSPAEYSLRVTVLLGDGSETGTEKRTGKQESKELDENYL